MALSFYPSALGEMPVAPVSIENNEIINITAFKKAEIGEGYIIRLFNPVETEQTATLRFKNITKKIEFSAFEIKTLRCTDNEITESNLLENLLD
jgi:alpha-mannosidase